jgi:hypothetical protein
VDGAHTTEQTVMEKRNRIATRRWPKEVWVECSNWFPNNRWFPLLIQFLWTERKIRNENGRRHSNKTEHPYIKLLKTQRQEMLDQLVAYIEQDDD